MAQPKNKRLVTEKKLEDEYLRTEDLDLDGRVSEVLGVSGTQSRSAIDTSFVTRNEFAGLMRWYAAYAARDTKPARVAIISDYEGVGATAPIHRNRWHRMLELALRGPGAVGGPGFIPALYASSGMTDPTTRTGGTVEESISQFGPGGRMLNARDGAVVAWPSETITGYRVWYTKGDFFSGQGQIKVDAGAAVATINSSNGGAGPVDALSWPALPAVPQSVTRGAHVISVTGVDGGASVQLGAVELFDGDENKGVHVYDLGRSGLGFIDVQDNNWSPTLWGGWINNINPQLVIIMLGGSKFGNDNDWTEIHIQNTLNRADAMANKATSSVLVVAPPRPVKNPPGDPNVWADYVTRMKQEVALRADRMAFLDMQSVWPTLLADGSTNLGLMHEATNPYNPSAAGQRRFVDILMKVLV